MHALESLRDLLGPDGVLIGDRVPRLYRRDMLTSMRGFPMPPEGWAPAAVALPRSTESVSALLRAAYRNSWKVSCWGGGTNLMGSAAPVHGEIVVDLREMNRLELDAPNRRVRAQAGAIIRTVEEAAGAAGLTLGHDPWTFGQATVGGTISTDSVGYLAARYGSMGQTVLGLTLVLADGTIVVKRDARRWPGFSLSALAVGMEGTLAVVTEAVLRLRAAPERRELAAFRFPDFASGFRASCDLAEVGPSLLEFNEPFAEGMRLLPEAGPDSEPLLYAAFEGVGDVVDAQLRAAGLILERHGGLRCGPEVAQAYWESRHAIADLYVRDREGRSAGDEHMKDLRFDYVHVALPLNRVLEYRRRVLELLSGQGMTVFQDSLWVHPELFSVYFVRPRRSEEEDTRRMAEAVDGAVRLCHELGGSMEYCHGVGLRLSHHLGSEMGRGLEVVDRIKSALDPRGVLPRLGRRAGP